MLFDKCRLCRSGMCDVCVRSATGCETPDAQDHYTPYRDPGEYTNDLIYNVATANGTFFPDGDIVYFYEHDCAVAVDLRTGKTSNNRVIPPSLLEVVRDAVRIRQEAERLS